MDWVAFLPSIFFLLFLFLISAFFSAAESSLTASSPSRMHALADQGDWKAAVVQKIMHQKDLLISTILLGNNVANILATALTTSIMIMLFDEAGIYIATAILTVILVIFTELLPKTYSLYHADFIARWLAPIMNVLMLVCRPLAVVMTGIVRFFLTSLGLKIERRQGSDIDELRGAIELYEGPGEESRERRNMLRSIMDLTDMTVEDVMVHRRHMNSVNFGQPTEAAIAEILSYHHTRIPLWSSTPENIIGVVHVKQLLFALNDAGGDATKVDLLALMSRPWFVPNTTTLLDQLQAFRARREHFAVVVDEYGTLMGAMTLEDILEEIVGNIDDEKDFVAPGVRKLPDGSFQVNGNLPIRDLNRQMGWDLPDDQDYTTVAGLILYESRVVPDVGQSFSFHGYQFDVVKRQRHQISLVRMVKV